MQKWGKNILSKFIKVQYFDHKKAFVYKFHEII